MSIHRINIAWFLIALLHVSIDAQSIECNNLTPHTVFIALYTADGTRISPITTCTGLGTCTVHLPEKRSPIMLVAEATAAALAESKVIIPEFSSRITATTTKKSARSFSISILGDNQPVVYATTRTDTITLKNVSNKTFYAALYYQRGSTAYRFGNTTTVPAHESIELIRPEQKCASALGAACTSYVDRNIYMSTEESPITPILTNSKLPFVNAGELKGNEFYIYEFQGTNHIGTQAEWMGRASIDTIRNIFKPDITAVKKLYDALPYPGKGKTAQVTRGAALSEEENRYRSRHQITARPLFEKLGVTIPKTADIPHIAFCFSGGGVRAMITALGVLLAAEENGFLGCVSYISALSGSTWSVTGWEYSGTSVSEYVQKIIPRFAKSPLTTINSTIAQEAILKKIAFGQPYSIVDYYGAALGVPLLAPYSPHNNPNRLFLGESIPRIERGAIPFPICTMVTPKQYSDRIRGKNFSDYYTWIECNPYTIRALANDTLSQDVSIPSWAFGRKFVHDISSDAVPPLSVANMCGIYGSAFSINTLDAIHIELRGINDSIANQLLTTYGKNSALDILMQQRTSPAQVFNFIEDGLMTLLDAGVSCNLPFPPLLKKERSIKLIIALDVSENIHGAPALHLAEKLSHGSKLPFPAIDWNKTSQPYSVHPGKPNSNEPTIVYIPLMAASEENAWNPYSKATRTAAFEYPTELSTKLLQRGKEMFYAAFDPIRHTVQEMYS